MVQDAKRSFRHLQKSKAVVLYFSVFFRTTTTCSPWAKSHRFILFSSVSIVSWKISAPLRILLMLKTLSPHWYGFAIDRIRTRRKFFCVRTRHAKKIYAVAPQIRRYSSAHDSTDSVESLHIRRKKNGTQPRKHKLKNTQQTLTNGFE